MFHSFADRLPTDAHEARDPVAPLRQAKAGSPHAFDTPPLRELGRSLAFNLLVRLKALGNILSGKRGPAIWVGPTTSRLGRSIRSAIVWGGMRVAASPGEADLACRFNGASPAPRINARCHDISRTHVARTFHRAFGYPLLIDSTRYVGWAVEKSDAGAMNDSRLVACPVVPRPGKSYQKLIDASDAGQVTDLRTHCIGGRPVVVWVETRRESDRFARAAAVRTACMTPSDVFTDEEMAAIEQFLRLIGLDWGTLDILRCRADRRLYIVDVDLTDIEPVSTLPMRGKLESTRLLADLLATAAGRPGARIPATARIRRGFA